MFISVLLPLPELPMIATKSPRSMRSETLRSARTLIWPRSKIFVDVVHLDHRDARGRRSVAGPADVARAPRARDQRPAARGARSVGAPRERSRAAASAAAPEEGRAAAAAEAAGPPRAAAEAAAGAAGESAR